MRIRLAVPDELDDLERRDALNAALEAVTIADTGLLKRGLVPRADKVINSGRIRWKPEPPGDEHFDLATTVVGRGHGDCDDLAPYWASTLRATGVDPHARAIVRRSGPTRWHAIVRRGDGSIEDPSRAAGMGHKVSGDGPVKSPIAKPMSADGRLCIAICPSKDKRHPRAWFARCDASDRLEPWAWSTMAAHPAPQQALLSAVRSMRTVAGDELDEEDDARLAVLHDLVLGADPYEIAEALNEESPDVDAMRVVLDGVHSVGFWKELVSKAAPLLSATPFAPVVSMIAPGSARPAKPGAPLIPGMGMPGGMPGMGMPMGPPQMPIMQMKDFFSMNPALAPLAQAILPLAGTLFGGPLGAMGGSMLSQFVAPPTGTVMPGQVAQPWGIGGPAVLRF